MILEQTLRFVETIEAGKRSAAQLLLPHTVDAAVGSTYKHQKKSSVEKPPLKEQDTCSYCGKRGHGKNASFRVRQRECPAYRTTCGHCNKDHHFECVCRGKSRTKVDKVSEHENAIFDALCELTILTMNVPHWIIMFATNTMDDGSDAHQGPSPL